MPPGDTSPGVLLGFLLVSCALAELGRYPQRLFTAAVGVDAGQLLDVTKPTTWPPESPMKIAAGRRGRRPARR